MVSETVFYMDIEEAGTVRGGGGTVFLVLEDAENV